jgi:VanZ family protein
MEQKEVASVRWLITGAYFVFLTLLLVTPDPLGLFTFGERLPRPKLASSINDKVAHAGTFAVLIGLIIWSMRGKRLIACFAAVAFYGAATEVIQAFVPNRTADVLDWLADVAGAAVGLVLLWLIYRMWR